MIRRVLVCLAAALAAATPGCTVGGYAGPLRPKVLWIAVGGVRPDAAVQGNVPVLSLLMEDGCMSPRVVTEARDGAGPSYATLLTGVWSREHRVVDDSFERNRLATHPTVFEQLEAADLGLRTAALVRWKRMGEELSGGALEARDFESDEAVRDAAVEYLDDRDPDFLFVQFAGCGRIGSAYGSEPHYPEYRQCIHRLDQLIGHLRTAVRRRGSFEREAWLILVTAVAAPLPEPDRADAALMVVSGRRAARGLLHPPPALVDPAPTVLAYFGAPVEPEWGLAGRPRGLAESETGMQPGIRLFPDEGPAESEP